MIDDEAGWGNEAAETSLQKERRPKTAAELRPRRTILHIVVGILSTLCGVYIAAREQGLVSEDTVDFRIAIVLVAIFGLAYAVFALRTPPVSLAWRVVRLVCLLGLLALVSFATPDFYARNMWAGMVYFPFGLFLIGIATYISDNFPRT